MALPVPSFDTLDTLLNSSKPLLYIICKLGMTAVVASQS